MVAVAGPVAHDLALALVERPVAAQREVIGSGGRRARHKQGGENGGGAEKGYAMSIHAGQHLRVDAASPQPKVQAFSAANLTRA